MEGCDALKGYFCPPTLTLSYMNSSDFPQNFILWCFIALENEKINKQKKEKYKLRCMMKVHEGQEVIHQHVIPY